MSGLNLLPWREEARKRTKRSFILSAVLCLIMGVLAVLAWQAWLDHKIDYQNQRNVRFKQEIKQLELSIKEIKNLEETRHALNERIAIIDQL